MRRVVVIGCFGAGKSLFAAELSRLTGLKLHQLDHYFRPQGRTGPDREEWLHIQQGLVAGQDWIIEGNYGATIDLRLRRADTMIYLDFSTSRCFLGVLCRIIRSRFSFRRGPDIVEGCNERLDFRFLRSVLAFNRRHREGIIRGVSRYPHVRMIRLGSRKEVRDFLAALGRGEFR